MKIFILSNITERAERLADALGNYDVSIVSREMEGDTESIENEVSKVIGKADSVVFVVKDPIKATMDLNKMSGISAAQCVSGSDINSARRNGANVIVMGGGANAEDFAEYLAKGAKQKFNLIKPKNEAARGLEEPVAKPIVAKKVQNKVVEQMPEDKKEEEDDGYDKDGVKGGFIGRLKHSLGIVDSEEQDEEEE